MGVCRTAERVRVVSDSEELVVFVTLYGEYLASNISETHRKILSWKAVNRK
jgi:hypothetical protein